MTAEPHCPHGPDELCDTGSMLYVRALQESRVARREAERAPCLIDFGLLQPDADTPGWLRPTPPDVALPRLAALFEPFFAGASRHPRTEYPAAVTVLHGVPRIQEAVTRTVADTGQEVLSVQPGGARPPEMLAGSLDSARGVLARGGRLRALYPHTSRHSPDVQAYFEGLDGDAEARILDEVPERLFVFDRAVAFIPAAKKRDIALEIRHPALVDYLVTTFQRFWALATPMHPRTAPLPVENGITTRQRVIAGLLIEGLTDAEIADRLGMNIRTARVHIAKLAATLGSNSRAQLGYLIGQSEILNQRT